jgi:hypothetical protein
LGWSIRDADAGSGGHGGDAVRIGEVKGSAGLTAATVAKGEPRT